MAWSRAKKREYAREWETIRHLSQDQRRAHMKAWREANSDFRWKRKRDDPEHQVARSEAAKEASKRFRERNPDYFAAWRAARPGYMAIWRAEHPGYHVGYYARNRDHLRAYAHARHMANPLRRQVRTGPYLSQHPEAKTIKNRLRRFRVGGTKHRHRARYFGVAYEPIDRIAVFERDSWSCWLCHCATPPEAIGTRRLDAPELDHVIPMSRGGPHSWDNVRCACHKCNMAKGNTMPDEFFHRSVRRKLQDIKRLLDRGFSTDAIRAYFERNIA